MMIKYFCIATAVIGLAMAIFGVYFIGIGRQAVAWPQTPGQVVATSIRIDRSNTDRGLTAEQRARTQRYYPEIQYRWSVDGQQYSGSRYRLGSSHEKFDERDQAQAAAALFPPQSSVTVHYDPHDPASAVLDPAASSGIYVPLPLGLLLLGVGLLGLRYLPQLQQAVPD